jgi:FkbM family methyltransferase
MGIYKEKYTREYFTGVDSSGNQVGNGATIEFDENGIYRLRQHDYKILEKVEFSNKKVLDIGYGRGEAICYAYLHGASLCMGVDFSDAAFEITKELFQKYNFPETTLYKKDALDFVREYAEKYRNSSENKFDVIIMLDVVEHIPRSELRIIMGFLQEIMTDNAIIIINTPAYKYDNDVVQDGFDERNLEGCCDTSDTVPQTKGMYCNKYTNISLQDFMAKCGFINITEAHFFISSNKKSTFLKDFEHKSYFERYGMAVDAVIPLKLPYQDDDVEFPYEVDDRMSWYTLNDGNMSGISLLLTKSFCDAVFVGGNYDLEMYTALAPEEVGGKIVFDVGAHIGVSSLLFSKAIGPNGRVLAFEPNPWNRNRMLLNLSHNQSLAENISVYDCAIGDMNGDCLMIVSSEIDNGYSSTSRISQSHPKILDENLPGSFESISVKICMLDRFVEENKIYPDVIKIDIEGSEQLLLQGALETIIKYKPILFIEMHSEYCALQCATILNSIGYCAVVLKEEPDNRILVKARFSGKNDGIESSSGIGLMKLLTFQNDFVIRIQNELANAIIKYRDLLNKYNSLQVNIGQLKTKLDEKSAEISSLMLKRDELQNSYNKKALGLELLQKDYNSALDELAKIKHQYNDLDINYQGALSDSKTYLSEISAISTEIDDKNKLLLLIEKTKNQEITNLQSKIDDLNNEIGLVNDRYFRLHDEYLRLSHRKIVVYTDKIIKMLKS